MPSSTLLAAPSHAPCPVRAGAAPEVGPGKRMRRQILLKPAAPPTPPWSAGNYPSDTTFANPFTCHLDPSHYLYKPRLNTSHLCAQACAQESGRRARRNQGWHKQEAGSRTQDAGRKAGASEACEARRHAQGSAIPRTPTCHKALALPRQNVPVTVSTTLRAAEPRGLRGSPCPSACRHSSTRTLSACACTARRVAVMWPLVTCCLRSRAPRAGWHTQEFPLAGVLWRVAVPLPPWSAPLSTVGVACLHARAFWALLVLADKTCKDVWVRQPDGA